MRGIATVAWSPPPEKLSPGAEAQGVTQAIGMMLVLAGLSVTIAIAERTKGR